MKFLMFTVALLVLPSLVSAIRGVAPIRAGLSKLKQGVLSLVIPSILFTHPFHASAADNAKVYFGVGCFW